MGVLDDCAREAVEGQPDTAHFARQTRCIDAAIPSILRATQSHAIQETGNVLSPINLAPSNTRGEPFWRK